MKKPPNLIALFVVLIVVLFASTTAFLGYRLAEYRQDSQTALVLETPTGENYVIIVLDCCCPTPTPIFWKSDEPEIFFTDVPPIPTDKPKEPTETPPPPTNTPPPPTYTPPPPTPTTPPPPTSTPEPTKKPHCNKGGGNGGEGCDPGNHPEKGHDDES